MQSFAVILVLGTSCATNCRFCLHFLNHSPCCCAFEACLSLIWFDAYFFFCPGILHLISLPARFLRICLFSISAVFWDEYYDKGRLRMLIIIFDLGGWWLWLLQSSPHSGDQSLETLWAAASLAQSNTNTKWWLSPERSPCFVQRLLSLMAWWPTLQRFCWHHQHLRSVMGIKKPRLRRGLDVNPWAHLVYDKPR